MTTYQITLEIEQLKEGPYLGTSPDLPGLIVQASSPEEVIALAPDIARDLIEVMLEIGRIPARIFPLLFPIILATSRKAR
ncbi:MAG TPA: type II toxin-antitoxin system HicB family antitoxin [Anaerolineae bacterium]|nr:type II toxin-antitoxin system HicB family antitoxin [Anaerolineae bacterium]